MEFLSELKELIEVDLQKQMGRPIYNKHLWTCLVLDFLLVQVLIGPFTVCIWRGAWELYDELFLAILGKNSLNVGGVCLTTGFFISVLVAVFCKEIDYLAGGTGGRKRGRKRYFLVTRIFSIIRFLTTLLYWKGMFDMLDSFTEWFVPQFSVTLAAAACLLFIIGSLKSAAISPPLGVDLDTDADYVNVSTVYRTNRKNSLPFRILDGFCTTVIEVVSVIAFYGAWGTGKWYFGASSDYLSFYNGGIALAQAHVVSLFVFITQFLYLHNHYKCKTQCCVRKCKNLVYSMLLIMSLFARASYIRGWWEILDILSLHTFPEHRILENFVCFFAGFIVVIIMGTASYNHFGVSREVRETDGILLPFFYLTYYLRDRKKEEMMYSLRVTKYRTHDAFFGKTIKDLGLEKVFNTVES